MRPLTIIRAAGNSLTKSGLTQRLIWFTVFVTLWLAISAAAISSYFAYQDAWHSIEQVLTAIKRSQVPIIAENIRTRNTALLAEQVKAIKRLPHVMQVTVSDGNRQLARTGDMCGHQSLVTRQLPITCLTAERKVMTGMLTVTICTDHIAGDTVSYFLAACCRNIALLALLAVAVVLYLNGTFIEPLRGIRSYAEKLAPERLPTPLVLDRRIGSLPDEIDALAAALNSMRVRLQEEYGRLMQNESSLRTSQAFLTELLHAAPDLLYWKDADGVYRGCSARFALLAGLSSPESVVGKSDLMLPTLAASARSIREIEATAFAEQREATGAVRAEAPESGTAALLLRCVPIPDPDGLCRTVMGSATDITELQQVRAARDSSRLQFEQFFNLPLTGVLILSADKSLLRANPAACALLGYTERELQQISWTQLIHPDDLPLDTRQFKQLQAGVHDTGVREARLIKKNGGIAYAALAMNRLRTPPVQPDQYHVAMQDLSRAREGARKLYMLNAAVSQIQEIVIITDPKAVIQYVNPAFTRATGYAGSQVLGKTPSLLRSGKHDDGFYKNLWATITRGETWRGRFVNKKCNGELYDEEAYIYPVRDDAGAITNYLAVKRDITHDLKIEHQLRQVQKMEAIGTLAGGIAHDFNNILGVIYGYAEMSMDPQETLPQIHGNLEQMINATNRAKDLIRQILTISRQAEKEAMPVTVSPIVKEVVKFIRASLPSSIQIKQTLAAKNDLLLADPIQIHQLLMNLCTNAGHAMQGRNGVMEIALRNVHFSDADIHEYPLMHCGDYICLSVRDTGCGIPPEHMEHIFEPYFTTKEASEGTGLGLAVVHGIVRNCGGDIRVYSEPGQGSAFNVYLPLISRSAEQRSEPALAAPGGTEHVMFVDDELPLVKTSTTILERLGYRVTAMTDPEAALAALRDGQLDIDLIITDKTMPGLTGFELAVAAKKLRPGLPVILCTGMGEKSDLEKVQGLGIDALLLKPFNKQELAGIIREVLNTHSARNQT